MILSGYTPKRRCILLHISKYSNTVYPTWVSIEVTRSDAGAISDTAIFKMGSFHTVEIFYCYEQVNSCFKKRLTTFTGFSLNANVRVTCRDVIEPNQSKRWWLKLQLRKLHNTTVQHKKRYF